MGDGFLNIMDKARSNSRGSTDELSQQIDEVKFIWGRMDGHERSLWLSNSRKINREYLKSWTYHLAATTFLIYAALVHIIPLHPQNHLLLMSIGFIFALNIFTVKFILENRKKK